MQFFELFFFTFARKSVRVCSRSAINASIMALASLGFLALASVSCRRRAAAWLVQEPQTCQPKGCENGLRLSRSTSRSGQNLLAGGGSLPHRLGAGNKERNCQK